MKRRTKTAVVSLCLTVAVLCTSCKSSEVKNTESLIDNIGNVTLSSKESISVARDAYDALGSQQQKVENIQILQDAEQTYEGLLKKEAAPIEAAINSIPQPITMESSNAIDKANSLYARASEDVQKQVSNIEVLNEAQKALNDIAVENAIAAIDAIGTVTLDSQNAIDTATAAYQAVDASRRSDVTNYSKLTDANTTLKQLNAEAKEAAGKAAIAKLKKTTDEVEGITWYEPSCMPKYINSRSYVLPYLGERNGHYWMRCKVDYAANDWVFFDRIIINIDGVKRDTISFGYGEVSRDTAFGAYLSEVADFAPTDSQIKLFEDIANSEKTIIRFQGDDHYYDLTVPAKDKQGIKDVLAAYEYVK